MKKTPPVLSRSRLLLGHALEFRKERTDLFRRGYEEHGKVFTIKLGPKPAAVLVGPEFATLFFKETDKKLNMAKPYGFLRQAIGNVVFVADHQTYMNQRPTLYAPFTREKMLRYITVMQDTVQNWLDNLPDEGRMDISSEMNSLVQQVAGYCFGGKDFMDKVGKEFWEHFVVIGKSLDPMIPAKWPVPKFVRRDRARKKLAELLGPILAERRQNPEKYDDVLQDMINTPYKDGQPASDEDLLALTIGIMFAGHETTAGQAAWTLIQLLQNPTYLYLLRNELNEKFPLGSRMEAKTLIHLKMTKYAVDETTRMHPSADLVIRVTDEPLEVGDYVIPENWPVFLAVDIQGRMSEIFSNPNWYDPLRFSPERAEHKKEKNSIAGFGGGIHKCTGMNFANNEMQIITALLFQQFDLELESGNPAVVRDLGASRPGPAWVRFKRKPNTADTLNKIREEATAAGCPHFSKADKVEAASHGVSN